MEAKNEKVCYSIDPASHSNQRAQKTKMNANNLRDC